MPERRFYSPLPFSLGALVELEEDELHHLLVMRPRPGEEIELVNGLYQLARARVDTISKKKADLSILEVFEEAPPVQKLLLAQGLPRMNRLDTIIEKATELGADEILLFPCEGSEKGELSPSQKTRVEAISISAMKQSGRLGKPQIRYSPSLQNQELPEGSLFYGSVEKEAPLFLDELLQTRPKGNVTFFVGPEKGFSIKEIDLLIAKGAKGVSLHKNILRTDTAPLAALAVTAQVLMR